LLALFEGLKSLGMGTGQVAALIGGTVKQAVQGLTEGAKGAVQGATGGATEGTKSLLLKMAQGAVCTLDDKPDGQHDGHQKRWQSARR
jgi:uncharacterized membrane protein